jgi:hypothetical protein
MLPGMIAPIFSAFGFATEYTTIGQQTIGIPVGATSVTIECIASGFTAPFSNAEDPSGGAGGAYSKTINYSLAGLTALWLSVPAGASGDAMVRANNSVGPIICLAKGGGSNQGGSAASGVGDVKFSGGNTVSGGVVLGLAGGGAAGPNGPGGNCSGSTPGTAGGSPAGSGGTTGGGAGQNYGGGGGCFAGLGAQGWIKLTWR